MTNNTNKKPNLSKPLIQEPAQAYPHAQSAEDLGPLALLEGTWTNQNIHGTKKGGPASPYSYNVMPMPQYDASSPTGYILKNFSYYEEITFSNIHGNAPNRGGNGTQVANTLFYEQRVFFGEGPNKDALVHAENGSFLYLTDRKQLKGPYGDDFRGSVGNTYLKNSVPPTQPFNIVKQISVPHGNSILASGYYQKGTGEPLVEAVSALPPKVNTDQYLRENVGNLNPEFTMNPNLPLNLALNVKNPTSYVRIDVDTQISQHPVSNIKFEQDHALVTDYKATYWLEAFDGSDEFTQLQYTQTIFMQMNMPNVGTVIFPHITTNTLTKV